MLDVAFHFSNALLILAKRWSSYPHQQQGLKTDMLKWREINIIRRRVVQDLALAFTLDEAIVEDVLGPPEMLHAGCNPDLDMNLNLFPDMEWVPRDVQVSGVHLWSTIPDVISQALYRSLEERMSDFRGPDGHAYDSRFQGQGQGLGGGTRWPGEGGGRCEGDDKDSVDTARSGWDEEALPVGRACQFEA